MLPAQARTNFAEAADMAQSGLPSADRNTFVDAMSSAVTGVNIVTTNGPGGLYGITVSAVASVSADPPMILACVNRRSPACNAIRSNGAFCVNLLAAHHMAVSDVFAGRPQNGDAFDFRCADWQPGATGSAKLSDAVATFDCVLDSAHDAGSHTIFIGRVVEVSTAENEPLAYYRRSYCKPSRLGSPD